MQLTGLEMVLCITAGGTVTAFLTHAIKDRLNKNTYINNREYSRQMEICEDRFTRGNTKMERTADEVIRLAKRFERFIVYSELSKEVKVKILDGD